VIPPNLLRIALLGFLSSSANSVADELFYVPQLPEKTHDPEMNAEARRKLSEYAHASKLVVLKEGDPDQVRIWITWANFLADTIGYETKGYVFSDRSAWVCHIKYPRSEPAPFTGSCAPEKHRKVQVPSATEIEALAKLSGSKLDCGVMDGAWLEIEGVYNGHPFALESSNPDQCTDYGSRVIAQVMAHVWR
jgi:hypothetical protein